MTGRPPQVLGQGACGLVLQAEYRGTPVAVKRAIPFLPQAGGGGDSAVGLAWGGNGVGAASHPSRGIDRVA